MNKKILFFFLILPILFLFSCNNHQFKFASDFPQLTDLGGCGKGQEVRGFGGIKKNTPLKKTPIIFVHGNGANSDFFIPLAKLFYQAGYSKQEIWAFSYLGYPSILERATPHVNNIDDLNQFIQAVLDYTGSQKVSLITHSLGVTLSLYWLKKSNTYHLIENFIAVAGAINGFPGMEDIEWSSSWMSDNIRLNGDVTPYGKNNQEKNHVPPTNKSSIFYIVAELGKDDLILNLYGANTQSALLEGADVHYPLEGKIKLPDNILPIQKQCGAHCFVVTQPQTLFNLIIKHF